MNNKEFNSLIRTDISEHLVTNNENIKVGYNTSEGIIFDSLNFNIDEISFIGKVCNYQLIDKDKDLLKIDKINRITFNNCSFIHEPIITSDNIWSIEFNDCIFLGINNIAENILADTNKNKKVYFKSCKFEEFKLGDIRHMQYNSNIKLSYFELIECEIINFTIENIEIASKFYINKQYDGNDKNCKISKLTINNVIFKENFKLHNCEVDEIVIKDTDFEEKADFYLSYFKSGLKEYNYEKPTEIYFSALNFKSLALFGDTKFDEKFHLKYVTLEGYSHFRNAKFKEGLDLDYTNTQNLMNFFGVTGLDTSMSKNNTSQETYRIIKYNFELLENKVEANKYHALELDQHRKDIWGRDEISIKLILDGIVTLFHWLSSNHSTNWLLVLFWIFIVGFFTTVGIIGNFDVNPYSYMLSNKEEIFKHMKLVHFGHDTFIFPAYYEKYKLNFSENIIMFFNKISLGYLYYQFLLSIRKDTRK